MNSQPHTHQPRLERLRDYSSTDWDNPWMLTYGDTRVRVCSGLRTPGPALVRRKTRKAIKRHDVGSRAAGLQRNRLNEARRAALDVVSEWGTNGR